LERYCQVCVVAHACINCHISTHYREGVRTSVSTSLHLIKLQRALDATNSLANLRNTPLGGSVADRSASREALPGGGVLGNRSSNTAGVQQPGALVEVVNSVAGLVVVLVENLAGNTAPNLLLRLGLDLVGASGGSAGRNVRIEERTVVGAAVELGGVGRNAGADKVLLVELLNLVAASGSGEAVGASVTVVDLVDVVGGGYHVEVEVGADLERLLGGEALDEVSRAEKAGLLARPEAEGDGVLHVVLGECLGNVEDTDGTAAVVVDTGSGADGVSVGAEGELVVLVTTLAGGQDVVGGDDLDVSQDVQSGGDLGTTGELGEIALTQLLADSNSRDIGAFGARRRAKGGRDGAGHVVVHDSTDCAGATSKSRLQTEVTAATGDEGDVASDAGRVVRRFTTEVAHGDQWRGNETVSGVRVLEEVGLDCLSVNGEGVDGAIQHDIVGERLESDIVVRGRLKLLLQPVDGVVVRLAAHDPVTVWVAVGEVLELLSTSHQLLGSDVGFEFPLGDS
jgi:hypothetical protein